MREQNESHRAAAAIADAVREGLRNAADPDQAPAMQAYMKSRMPFHGVKAPQRRRVVSAAAAAHRRCETATWLDAVEDLWRHAERREERYAAIDLLQTRWVARELDGSVLPQVEEMIRAGAWWDYVDPLATSTVGDLLRVDPALVRPRLVGWSTHEDTWLRRAAILAQLRFRSDTDTEFLEGIVAPSLGRREFFLAKAIGWALREYSKADPAWVADYIDRTGGALAPLAVREASKYI